MQEKLFGTTSSYEILVSTPLLTTKPLTICFSIKDKETPSIIKSEPKISVHPRCYIISWPKNKLFKLEITNHLPKYTVHIYPLLSQNSKLKLFHYQNCKVLESIRKKKLCNIASYVGISIPNQTFCVLQFYANELKVAKSNPPLYRTYQQQPGKLRWRFTIYM